MESTATITTTDPSTTGAKGNSDGLNLGQQLRMLWAGRNWIMAGTALFSVIGIAYAMLARQAFSSSATIALKESQAQGAASSVLSQLGGFGGMVAAQLGSANTNLDKLEVILTGEELALRVIAEDSLMPVLFPDAWDAERKAWKGKTPNPRDGADILMHDVLKVSVDRIKRFLELKMTSPNPVTAKKLVEIYLAALIRKLQEDARLESKTNRDFLEAQVNNTSDPIIREKILTMIAMEIEKEMLVGAQAIEILKSPAVPMYREFPKRTRIVVLAFLIGLGLSSTLVLSYPILKRFSGAVP
jgi:uncharacterized protein involved in exopolysaccharide biosynthesis